jgi:hypothetical protein
MIDTREVFESRLQEIDLFLNGADELIKTREILRSDNANTDLERIFYNDEFIKMLKANFLIMLYNLVEATISEGIREIYTRIERKELKYHQVTENIRNIWFDFKFGKHSDTSNIQTYKEKAFAIVDSVVNNNNICLNFSSRNINGNVDAKQIREICSVHGIQFTSPQDCRGGFVLKDIKDKRNELAHGLTSFTECGRNYSIDQLKSIKEETKIYLEGLINSLEEYYSTDAFARET